MCCLMGVETRVLNVGDIRAPSQARDGLQQQAVQVRLLCIIKSFTLELSVQTLTGKADLGRCLPNMGQPLPAT